MNNHTRVLIAHESMAAPGGGNGLAAYALQALVEHYHVSLACMHPPDCDWLNRFFGTNLRPGQYTTHVVPVAVQRAIALLPTPQATLRFAVLERFVKQLAMRQHFDVFLSTNNEFAFPARGIQYIHYPRTDLDRPDQDYHWYHQIPGALPLYRRLCRWIGGATTLALRRNLTLANSAYTASVYERLHGVRPRVVFPPVCGQAENRPWGERENQVVCLGRIAPEKEIPKVIDIMRRLRERGHSLRLTLVGAWDCSSADAKRLKGLMRVHQDWLTHQGGFEREHVGNILARSRYGIHGMVGEHFGMAVAEMLQAGCIPFVPHIGGPVEIVGGRRELIYTSADNAVEKMVAVLERPDLQQELHDYALARSPQFTAERFMTEIRAAVAFLIAESAG